MESWSYVLGGKGHVSNDPISSFNKFSRSNNAFMDWELKNQSNFENNLLVSGSLNIENGALGELGYKQLIEKQVADTSVGDALISKIDDRRSINTFMVTPNSFSLEDESTSRLSSTVMDSDSRGSSFIDLNLGRCSDPRDSQNCRISKSTSIVSLSESSAPPRRARIGVSSHTAYCQVYGCNKDLRSSKEYHKRHKVCEVHSKTARVTVNGIEQRFCQQCSRFHLLAEFDDGKRSCRKRLAGHNERRRKPQVGPQSGRNERLLHSFSGFASSRFHGTALTTSFIHQDILLNGLSHPEKYGANDWCKRIKNEDGSDFGPPSAAIPIANAHLLSKSLFPSYNFEKAFPTFHEDGANIDSASGNIFNESSTDRYPNVMGGRTSSSRSFLQDTSLGNDEFTAFDAASTIQGLSGITDSGCARSLLSSQSQNSSSHSSGMPVAHQLVVPRSNTYFSMGQVLGVSSQASTSGVTNKFPSRVMSSVEGGHLCPILIPENSHIVNFDITDGIYHGSHFVNAKDHIGNEDDTTIDLLQLSSQLQRVDHQKQSMQVKQEMVLSVAPILLNKTSNFFDE